MSARANSALLFVVCKKKNWIGRWRSNPRPVALGIFWFIDQSSANFYDQRERRNNQGPVSSDFQCFLGLPLKVLSRTDNKLDAAWQPAKCSLWLTVRFVFLAGGEVGLVKSSGHVRAAVRTAESRLWQIANPFS